MSVGTILVIDDEMTVRSALHANLTRAGWKVECASTVTEALARMHEVAFSLIITNIRMPDGNGVEWISQVRKAAPQAALILLTAYANVPQAVDAIKSEAWDYLVKPVSIAHLLSSVDCVLRNSIEITQGDTEHIVGRSPVLKETLVMAKKAARTDADILVEAESGTGKELLARLIHASSPRNRGPFVAINCAAVPENLLESELFGHVRGAFSGAIACKTGKFAQADGGTLLLDEIGEMPLALQPKLLRVLQEREVERLGDNRPVKLDIRIVATTNRSLRSMVDQGQFRADLYYRLNVIPLHLPPLRERRGDIPDLARHFLAKYAGSSQSERVLSPAFLAGLERYDWPGNVRELENFVHRVVALCTTAVIGEECLEPLRLGSIQREPFHPSGLTPGTSLREAEKRLLEMTLDATEGNRTRAAEMMGVSIRTIRNKIRDYGLPKRSYA